MMAGNPNWWSMHPPSLLTQYALASSSLPLNPLADNQEPRQSWSQLIIEGISAGDDDRFGPSHFQHRKVENWEGQILNPSLRVPVLDVIKQEASQNSNLYSHGEEEFQAARSAWSQVMPVSSPGSYATSFGNNYIYDFSYNKMNSRNQHPDHSTESASTTTGGVHKKARVQSSSSQPPLKQVRKEKLGDRITALHQLVSPFGKTDTASVLLEAIGYIRFLLGQIEALSSPYFGNTSNNLRNQQYCVQGERNCVFPEDPGQLVNDACLKRKGSAANQDSKDKPKEDLRSRGLCLVPVSCTQHVGSDNGADYWAPAFGSGFES
ncbi:transcription factor bHLH68-like isoform X2 [Juglans microcarpa x Juglans regia]|uniref:transcription factor bHLH68-like isoform X2 n=1 Tax=Juglans microcarpa x Juglans regia TaxID=2249226 RepID=UPI001B7E863C|nr:transcription factor bHLH68-like isoform X2 [Juglans microcarpa x Juglans regia]